MRITAPIAVLIAGALITLGLIFHAFAQGYELTSFDTGGTYVRLDRLTGRTDACFLVGNEKGFFTAPCAGRRH